LLPQVNTSAELRSEHRPKIILTWLLLLSFLSIWIYGFLLPAISSIDNSIFNFLLLKIYSNVCHQESAKCILIVSATMLVCARCTGIYFGALSAGLLGLFYAIPLLSSRVLMISILPLLVDVFLTFSGVYTYSQLAAFTTGLIFGSVLYLFLLNELEYLFSRKFYLGNE